MFNDRIEVLALPCLALTLARLFDPSAYYDNMHRRETHLAFSNSLLFQGRRRFFS